MKKQLKVSCPTCRAEVIWQEQSTWRPFCSERCRLIDLGAWADGSHAIPGEAADVQDTLPDSNGDEMSDMLLLGAAADRFLS